MSGSWKVISTSVSCCIKVPNPEGSKMPVPPIKQPSDPPILPALRLAKPGCGCLSCVKVCGKPSPTSLRWGTRLYALHHSKVKVNRRKNDRRDWESSLLRRGQKSDMPKTGYLRNNAAQRFGPNLHRCQINPPLQLAPERSTHPPWWHLHLQLKQLQHLCSL